MTVRSAPVCCTLTWAGQIDTWEGTSFSWLRTPAGCKERTELRAACLSLVRERKAQPLIRTNQLSLKEDMILDGSRGCCFLNAWLGF